MDSDTEIKSQIPSYVIILGKKNQFTFLFPENYWKPFLLSALKKGINSRNRSFRNAFPDKAAIEQRNKFFR